METWRLITTWGANPAFNMGLDEALLESAESPPTLRFYSWNPDTLSLGYFQRFEDVPGAENAGAVVRRLVELMPCVAPHPFEGVLAAHELLVDLLE